MALLELHLADKHGGDRALEAGDLLVLSEAEHDECVLGNQSNQFERVLGDQSNKFERILGEQ